MNRNTSRNFSANEKEIARLLKENSRWKERLAFFKEEINFLNLYLSADIFQKNILNLYERLQLFYDELQNFKLECLDLTTRVHNHRYDIEGILECEDISCEVFYHEEHLKLKESVLNFARKFRKFKLEVYSYTGRLLRRTSKEH
ncbi:hypothetical protein JRG66_12075 [Salinimicrobium tongyeongense]|uniref:Uncharacterized protein n=1 Tax=Salinimicrobium tongyeongense TaxID=2809707 RepID=A0ABY6NP67_9FLAO|nr:hypothetical protein [Salinimicrobium tongyeongense]UZH54700.1 hypothetical protein JRG66_12075 [Salinimicrobium tongyeongense]